jgi:hypothetical protein
LWHVIKTILENETNTEPMKYLIGVGLFKFRKLKNESQRIESNRRKSLAEAGGTEIPAMQGIKLRK